MPHGDGTGPAGMGPMTGRAAGYCTGLAVPGFANPAPGRGGGFGMGRGFGRGLGLGFRGGRGGRWAASSAAPPTCAYPAPYADPALDAQQALTALKGQAEYFGNALEQVKTRIAELEAEKNES